MSTNPYFNPYTYEREAKTNEDLVSEAIKIHGITLKYLPRTVFNEDILLGEDPLSKFDTALEIEMWVKSNTGFGGERDFLSKFNLELRDQVVFSMARNRWPQVVSEHLLDETSYNYQDEAADIHTYANSYSISLEAGLANNYHITSPRPMEGDLIYFAPSKDLFEIKFVEHEDPFYPHAKRYLYNLSCEKFRYSSEQIRTGNTEIDSTETGFSLDIRMLRYMVDGQQAGVFLDEESQGNLIQEHRIETQAKAANNEYISVQAKKIIDFSEHNPFSEEDRF